SEGVAGEPVAQQGGEALRMLDARQVRRIREALLLSPRDAGGQQLGGDLRIADVVIPDHDEGRHRDLAEAVDRRMLGWRRLTREVPMRRADVELDRALEEVGVDLVGIALGPEIP